MWIPNPNHRLEHPQILVNRSTKFLGFSFTMVQNPRYAISSPRNHFILLKNLGLCLRLEPNKHEHSGNWVSLPQHPKPPSRTDDDSEQRMRSSISGTYRLALEKRPRSHHSHFRTSLTKTNGI